MKQIVGSVVTLFTVAALAGCASSQPSSARSSGDVVSAMDTELAHTVDQGPEPVGTTTLTSATVEQETVLPEDRMSVKEANRKLQVEPLPEPASTPVPHSGN